MGDFRFVYGTARGPEGNFQARTDNLFASTDATPDVTQGNLFYTNNAAATTITYFDVVGANPVAQHQGKQIGVLCLDSVTTFADGASLRLRDGTNVLPMAGAFFEFVYVNSVWYETYRSLNTAGSVTMTSSNVAASGLVTISPAVTDVRLLAATASNMILRGLAGGYEGQRVTLHVINSSVTLGTNSAGFANSFIVRTVGGTSAIITGSGSVVFSLTTIGSTAKWLETSAISATSA